MLPLAALGHPWPPNLPLAARPPPPRHPYLPQGAKRPENAASSIVLINLPKPHAASSALHAGPRRSRVSSTGNSSQQGCGRHRAGQGGLRALPRTTDRNPPVSTVATVQQIGRQSGELRARGPCHDADSGRRRPRFRNDVARHSEIIPLTVPRWCRPPFRDDLARGRVPLLAESGPLLWLPEEDRQRTATNELQPQNFGHVAHGRPLCWHPLPRQSAERSHGSVRRQCGDAHRPNVSCSLMVAAAGQCPAPHLRKRVNDAPPSASPSAVKNRPHVSRCGPMHSRARIGPSGSQLINTMVDAAFSGPFARWGR